MGYKPIIHLFLSQLRRKWSWFDGHDTTFLVKYKQIDVAHCVGCPLCVYASTQRRGSSSDKRQTSQAELENGSFAKIGHFEQNPAGSKLILRLFHNNLDVVVHHCSQNC